jgi:hypothetical protein
VLDHADSELANLCSSKATAEEQAKCCEVWKFYHDKRQQAQSGCRLELETEGREGNSCAQLDTLERMVYEVAFSGDAEQLYHVLRTQSNMAKRSAQGSPEASSKQEVLDNLKAKALTMFEQIDLDGNGVIDREEFLSAMALLQHHLGDTEMEMIFSCMDSHGYLTPDQFVNIVQAEQMCDTGSDADVLRHVPHARPNWWSDAPHYIMDV